MTRTTKDGRSAIGRATKAQRRSNVTRLLVQHVVSYYGRDDPLKWPTDMLVSLARTLKELTPRNGW